MLQGASPNSSNKDAHMIDVDETGMNPFINRVA